MTGSKNIYNLFQITVDINNSPKLEFPFIRIIIRMPSWFLFKAFIKISRYSLALVQFNASINIETSVKTFEILWSAKKIERPSRIMILHHSQKIPLSKITWFQPPAHFMSDTISLLFMLVSIFPSQTDLVISLESFLVDSNQCLHLQSIHSNTFSSSSYSWSNWW